MKISGLRKLTLLDYPGHTACTVFTSSCNFRCPFCHNASLVECRDIEEVPEEEFFAFLAKRHGILDGVAVTGGEPTLQPDLLDFIMRVHADGFKVKLDSNGYQPGILSNVLSSGCVDYVAMDIKSSRENYARAAGLKRIDLSKIEESIKIIKDSGIEYEFRTTAVKGIHTPTDFLSIGKWLGDVPAYFIQKFTDSGDLLSDGYGAFSDEEMTSLLAMARIHIKSASLRGVE
ncbi:MAG: anaerobic ribonucleoside-triphosphate reductase activating protein [Clostridia bacterium]|nr:anaerobic ribonucleoside-triphosphate reductase activating protein [Clostridia bacterium]